MTSDFEPTETIPGLSYEAGEKYYAPGEWERRVDSKLKMLTLEVHVTAAGTIVLILGAAIMGRTIVKLLQAQGQVFNILSSAGIISNQPTVPVAKQEDEEEVSEQSVTPSSGVKYAQASGSVDTSAAGPVDPELLDQLKEHVAQDPLRDPDGLIG